MIINPSSLYTYSTMYTLKNASSATVGTLIVNYEIRRYEDLRNLNSNKDDPAYQIICTQRIIIPNSTFDPASSPSSYTYPAIAMCNVLINDAQSGKQLNDFSDLELICYSPKTINAAVSTSTSSSDGQSASISHQHTSGSSMSQTNTFGTSTGTSTGVSVAAGFFGDAPTGDVSYSTSYYSSTDTSNSTSQGTSQSSGNGNAAANSRTSSIDDSMTIKDWACYTQTDAISFVNWIWGQEYPWNVTQFTDGGNLPSFVSQLLYTKDSPTGTVLPPSDLSLFGINFAMKSLWVVKQTQAQTIKISHDITYYTANHAYSAQAFTADLTSVSLAEATFLSETIDLCRYGLDPISSGAAIVGFIPSKFIVVPLPYNSGVTPAQQPTPFKIISSGNSLLIEDTTSYPTNLSSGDNGAGFTSSQIALIAQFTPDCNSLQMTLYFKIIDTVNDYTLFIKHWITGNTNIKLTLTFGDPTDPNSVTITKYVDAQESQGGESNLLAIALRNQDYGSVDYHDFIRLGFNSITIQMTPVTPPTAGNPIIYQMRAISIERN